MFEDENITKEKIKDILYAVRNEFENELDYDYESDYKKDLKDEDFDMMIEFLDRFIHKVDLVIDDEVRDTTRDLELLNGLINYVVELWDISETSEEIIERFKQIGFTDDDLERLGIKDLY